MIFTIIYFSTIIFLQIYGTIQNQDPKLLFVLLIQPFIIINQSKNLFLNKKNTIILSILLFQTFYLFTSWFFSDYQYYSTRALSFYWSSTLFFLTGFSFKNDINDLHKFFKIISILLAISSIYVIGEYFGFIYSPQINKFPIEVSGHIGHKNVFGILSLFTILYSLFNIIYKKNLKFYLPIFLVTLLALLFSDSRGAFILCLIGIFLIPLPYIIENSIYKKASFRYLLYTLISIIIVTPLFFWSDKIWVRFALLFTGSSLPSHREAIYIAQINMFLSNPLFGTGIGSFIHENTFFLPKSSYILSNGTLITHNGHNNFLEILSETGVIGFILIMFFWLGAIFLSIKKLIKQWNYFEYLLSISLILISIHGFFSVSTMRLPVSLLLWFLIGYFWKFNYKLKETTQNPLYKKIFNLIVLSISSFIILIFGQLLLADFYYLKSEQTKELNISKVNSLEKSIKIFPNHPYTLNKLSLFALGAKDYKYALNSTSILNKTSPNLFPTNYIRGYTYFYLNELDSALHYVNKQIEYHNRFIDGYELKGNILLKRNDCKELNILKRKFIRSTSVKNIDKNSINFKKIQNLKNEIGIFRYKFSGPFLKKLYSQNYMYNYKISLKNQKTIESIINLECQ